MAKTKTPIPTVKPYSPGPDYDDMTPSDVRKSAPFQPGDVIYVERTAKVGGKFQSVARVAKVVRVDVERLKRRMTLIPVYRCVMKRSDGSFSDDPRYTLKFYPGDVYRAYRIMKATNGH